MSSSTSSFRINEDLRLRVAHLAQRLGKGKNWVINRALEEYVERHSRAGLRAEARRQSLAASGVAWKDQAFWERAEAEAMDE